MLDDPATRRRHVAVADWPLPRPEPEPFTTLAWRLWHVIDMYGEDRAPRWLDVPPQGDADRSRTVRGPSPPATAADAVALLERAHDRWDAHLALTDDERLGELVGPVGGGYADRTRAAYVLHMLDEFIHHGAEIALLRDLWRWQNTTVARRSARRTGHPRRPDRARRVRPRAADRPSSSTTPRATAGGSS